MPDDEITLPAQAAMVQVARAAVRALLPPECPRAWDAALLAGEFAADLITGGRPFTVRVEAKPGRVRLEVRTPGAPAGRAVDRDTHARRLALIDGHADAWGRDHVDTVHAWWAELIWEDTPCSRPRP